MTVKDKSVKGKKLVLFKVLAILFPLVLLLILEVLLRAFNYGHNTDLFIKLPSDDKYMVMNNYASDKYFSDTANATKGNHEPFQINKAPNTFRIFVLGESTTIGFPYFHNGSFHRWLQYRLMQMYPDKNFEIINLSLTAVNSYTVLDFGRQLPKYQPDAVLIYTGHNEYYGALGIGSTSYIGSNRFLVKTLLTLRELKLSQLLSNGMKKIAGAFAGNKTEAPRTLMQRMAAKQQIAYQSADYQAGINQFDKNMAELCSILNDNHIPTFLSTVVSNEKDLPPFISAGTGAASASESYKAGQLAYIQGNFAAAKEDFDKAKELDELRFRAPDAINGIIKKLTTEYPDVHLVDTKKFFEQYSPHGIIGGETILEHVHPNLYGYAVMSEAFYQAIQQNHLIKDSAARVMTFDELLKEMPVTRLDSLSGLFQVMMLKTGWPFNQPLPPGFKIGDGLEDRLAGKVALGHVDCTDAMGQLFENDKQTDNKQGATRIMEAMVLEYPNTHQYLGYAANLNAILGNFDKAAFYYKKLFMLTGDGQIGQSIYQLYLKADEPQLALPYLQYIPPATQAGTQKALAQIITDKQTLKQQPGNQQVKQRIAATYKQLGVDEAALKYSK